jgi:hypothetical protein
MEHTSIGDEILAAPKDSSRAQTYNFKAERQTL